MNGLAIHPSGSGNASQRKSSPRCLLTSWYLPLTSFAYAEGCGRCSDVDCHAALMHEEDHLHLPRVLDSLFTLWRQMDHAGAEEGHGEGLGELEIGTGNVAHLDGAGGVGNFCVVQESANEDQFFMNISKRRTSFFGLILVVFACLLVPFHHLRVHDAALGLPRV